MSKRFPWTVAQWRTWFIVHRVEAYTPDALQALECPPLAEAMFQGRRDATAYAKQLNKVRA